MAAAIAVAIVLAWKLRRIEMLLFGAVVFGVMFDAVAGGLARWLRLGRGWALALAGLIFAAILIGAISFFGFRFEAQVAQLIHSLPPAWAHFRQRLGQSPLGSALLKPLDRLTASPGPAFFSHLRGYAVSTGAAAAGLLLMVVAGLYLASQPDEYRRGVLRLFAPERRDRIQLFLSLSGTMLRRWLWVQASAMATIGVLTGFGLWVIGVPAAAALGVLAAIAEFVPLLGVLVASAPALLLAISQGWTTTAWTLALLIAIHQVDGNLLQPLLQRGIVSIPPVITLFALVAFGELFGLIGVIFAAPLAVVCLAAMQVYYPQPEPPGAPQRRALRLWLPRRREK